jgi:hypothetical protein
MKHGFTRIRTEEVNRIFTKPTRPLGAPVQNSEFIVQSWPKLRNEAKLETYT